MPDFDTAARLELAIMELKKDGIIGGHADLAAALGYKRVNSISDFVSGRAKITTKFVKLFCSKYGINENWLEHEVGPMKAPIYEYLKKIDKQLDAVNEDEGQYASEGDRIRAAKAFGEKEKVGILWVPGVAQMGYSAALQEDFAMLEKDLIRTRIKDFPYDGDGFRAWEAKGDSMEYLDDSGKPAGIADGTWLLSEFVPKEDWRDNLAEYRVHVIVTRKAVFVKRILQDNRNELVLHSDNEDYKQFRVLLSEIQEIWYVVRKLDWNMPPPRRISINV